MAWMFDGCYALKDIDVTMFDTQNVTDMYYMFSFCCGLTNIDLSNFNTKSLKNAWDMFRECYNLKTIYASEKFVTTEIEDGDNMFSLCYNLVGAVPYDPTKVSSDMANYITGYFTYSEYTGIGNVYSSNNKKIEYYDIQGHRLNKPQKGLNIIKCGNKTTKVYKK